MSKELEALERLKTAPSFMGGTEKYMFSTQSEIALLEDYEIIKQSLLLAQEQEKILKIIKTKNVMIYALKVSKTVDDYNELVSIDEQLVQEEFELLKRYFENE